MQQIIIPFLTFVIGVFIGIFMTAYAVARSNEEEKAKDKKDREHKIEKLEDEISILKHRVYELER